MGRTTRSLSAGLIVVLVAGCTAPPPRVVEVQVPVEVPGPVQWRPIPPELLTCPGRPALLVSGITGRELILSAQRWTRYAQCLEDRLGEIGRLSAPASP